MHVRDLGWSRVPTCSATNGAYVFHAFAREIEQDHGLQIGDVDASHGALRGQEHYLKRAERSAGSRTTQTIVRLWLFQCRSLIQARADSTTAFEIRHVRPVATPLSSCRIGTVDSPIAGCGGEGCGGEGCAPAQRSTQPAA